jgi:hypothetical protein
MPKFGGHTKCGSLAGRVIRRQMQLGQSATRVKHRIAVSKPKSSKPALYPIAMRPTTRLLTVEFRSLLLPPIRVPLRALQALHRPQCAPVPHTARPPQCLTQRRFLNLYKTAKAKTVLGQHKVLNFDTYQVTPPSDSKPLVNLYESDKKHHKTKLIASDISLQEIYDNHIKAGRMLYCTEVMDKKTAATLFRMQGDDIVNEFKDYAIVNAHTHNVPIDGKQRGSQLGGLKTLIFNLASPIDHHRIILDRAYQFIEAGKPVEFRVRLQGTKLTKEERHQPGDPALWPWMHTHFPHLRPDFIMKAMPEGTVYIVKPVSNGRMLQWVMSRTAREMAPMDLTRRLLRVKESVKQSIREGKQSQLPKIMRKQLAESGMTDYSPNTGLPRLQARQKFASGHNVKMGGEEKKYQARDAETDGFMLPDLPRELRIRREDPQEMRTPQEYRTRREDPQEMRTPQEFRIRREDPQEMQTPQEFRIRRETSEFTRTELQGRAPWKNKRGKMGRG